LPVKCVECGNEFDILDGISEVITSDNPFIQYTLRSNFSILGTSEITLGQLKEVDLKEKLDEIHRIFLTPISTAPYPVFCEAINRGGSRFAILSSKLKDLPYPDNIQIGWVVYGNKQGFDIPLWRKLLSNAKGYEINGDFRMAIVELETAFEIFIVEYLRKGLKDKYSPNVLEHLFQHFKRVEDELTILFEIATGKTLRQILKEANQPKLYSKWQQHVKEKRDRTVHRGENIEEKEFKEGFKSVFKIILLLDPEALNYLYHFTALPDMSSK